MKNYIYLFSYDHTEQEVSKLESKYIFHEEDVQKQLNTDVEFDPSKSAFINRRVDILASSDDYGKFIELIKACAIHDEDFKVEYLILNNDRTPYKSRLEKMKDIGWCIEGDPDYHNPKVIYAICKYDDVWCFGRLVKNTYLWHKHQQKPQSYSNSININIAKALVNIAADANSKTQLIDACCGVGTVLLEACFAGYSIEGCDINWKVCHSARKNLEHFGYKTIVYRSDIKDIEKNYDAGIVDLPYNLYTRATEDDMINIIKSSAAIISHRLVIVSTIDVSSYIEDVGLKIIDTCSVGKKGKPKFARNIWVCDKL